MHLIKRIILLVLISLVCTGTPALAREYLLTGKTMGTYYRIKFISSRPVSLALWEKKVKMRLKEVNHRLSMFQKESEISRFNLAPAHTPFHLSTDFRRVLEVCRRLHTLSGGAWDGTVKPLVDLWGFGVRNHPPSLPAPADLKAALARTGFNTLVLQGRTLTKTAPGVTLDLGSIAKGYGVDEIARLFPESNITNYLVEIGGELAGGGRNNKGNPWAVGISRPEKSLVNSGLYRVVSLDNMAIATSGNYRNFFELQGKTYSHIINPTTGYPVANKVVSASVIAGNCTLADGLATALMVMDPPRALELVNGMDNTECLILKKEGELLVPLRSKGFASFEVN